MFKSFSGQSDPVQSFPPALRLAANQEAKTSNAGTLHHSDASKIVNTRRLTLGSAGSGDMNRIRRS